MAFYPPQGPTPSAAAMQIKFTAIARDRLESRAPVTFRPNWLFIYGTLMDPEILQSILGLRGEPELRNAVVTGFQLKMWGVYPALVRNHDHAIDEVKGKIYWLESQDELEKLKTYETQAYQCGFCTVILEDKTRVSNAHVFEWAAGKEDRELENGSFDLGRFQRYFKTSLLGERPV